MQAQTQILYRLAEQYGILTAYQDVHNTRVKALPEAVLELLKAVGAPVTDSSILAPALEEARLEFWHTPVEPVIVCFDRESLSIQVKISSGIKTEHIEGVLELENGEVRQWHWNLKNIPLVNETVHNHESFSRYDLPLMESLPYGYHSLLLTIGKCQYSVFIISAPGKSFIPDTLHKCWGIFAPLYALSTKEGTGSGDFSVITELADWLNHQGGRVISTLPLLSVDLQENRETSPYLPLSRLFWNEFFIDIPVIPEFSECPEAVQLYNSDTFQRTITGLRDSSLVHYAEEYRIKEALLRKIAEYFFTRRSSRYDEFQAFRNKYPLLQNYGQFMALRDYLGSSWHTWPNGTGNGVTMPDCYREIECEYRQFIQWIASEQIALAVEAVRNRHVELYFDLPIGVHPDGFDTWYNQSLFMNTVMAGAPPDAVFLGGQNWKFPPLHPQKIRQQRYRYFIDSLRHHLRYAGMLRIDHIMGFHRLYCIPEGMSAADGAYIQYHPEEFYAIVVLESHRNKALIFGEDLGTVPQAVRKSMSHHGINRMYVLQYMLAETPGQTSLPNLHCVASIGTHDMPTFASFWNGSDIEEQAKLGIIPGKTVPAHREIREKLKLTLLGLLGQTGYGVLPVPLHTLLQSCLRFLSDSRARIVLVNLEDLWLETRQQNVPGTMFEYPNWRQKFRYSIDRFAGIPKVESLLAVFNNRHKEK